jgi:hypothetical protein
MPKRKVTKEKGSSNRPVPALWKRPSPAIRQPPHKSPEPAAPLLHPSRTHFADCYPAFAEYFSTFVVKSFPKIYHYVFINGY